ncbi:MAG: YchE family NAAT transporter [Geobacteraceae bacterium]|jgi:multiple antibiotic resistance protein
MLTLTQYIKILTALLVIVNPVGVIPIFVSLTSDQPPQVRQRTARVAALSVGMVLITSCLLGESFLHFFGVSIASFRVGGGLLLLLMAISMFNAQQSGSKYLPEESREAGEKPDIAVVPLSVPLLAGPGAISTIIIYSNQAESWSHSAILIAIISIVALTVWVVLSMAVPAVKMLGKTGINIVTRLMGLLLAAIAVEFIANGLGQLLPGLEVPHP